MQQKIINNKDLQKGISNGLKKIQDLLAPTMTIRGKYIALDKRNNNSIPIITNDGFYSTLNIAFEEPSENLALKSVKDAAKKTALHGGDSTTLTQCLVKEFYEIGKTFLEDPKNTVHNLEMEMNKFQNTIITKIDNNSTKVNVDDKDNSLIETAVAVAVKETGLAKMISAAIETSGRFGSINVNHVSDIKKIGVKKTTGFQLKNSGVTDIRLCTNPSKNETKILNCKVLLIEGHLNTVSEGLIKVLDYCLENNHNLVVVATYFDAKVATQIANYSKNIDESSKIFTNFVVASPLGNTTAENFIEDIALFLGKTKTIPQNEIPLNPTDIEKILANCKEVFIEPNKTWFVGEEGSNDNELVKAITNTLEEKINDENYPEEHKWILRTRISSLKGEATDINFFAPTTIDENRIRMKIEDGIKAAYAAIDDGLIVGGGVSLKDIFFNDQIEKNIFNETLLFPIKTIHKIIFDNEINIEDIKGINMGFNALDGTKANLNELKIYDTAFNIKLAFVNSMTAAKQLLLLNAYIFEE